MKTLIALNQKLAAIEGITVQQHAAIFEAVCDAAEAIAAEEVTRRLELADLRLRADARRAIPSNALPAVKAPATRKARTPKPANVQPAAGE